MIEVATPDTLVASLALTVAPAATGPAFVGAGTGAAFGTDIAELAGSVAFGAGGPAVKALLAEQQSIVLATIALSELLAAAGARAAGVFTVSLANDATGGATLGAGKHPGGSTGLTRH
jgi:hypothetical protein